jgi:neutral ceramidase
MNARLLLAVVLVGCGGDDSGTAPLPTVTPGAPVAGMAQRPLVLPVGTPLGGYSSRCGYLGSASEVDARDSAYTQNWSSSLGVYTQPMLKAMWLENGDQDLVLLKADVIYAFDGFVDALEARLEAETGRDMQGKVVFATNHSHASWSNYSDQVHFYLGGDRYNEEVFQRFVEQAAAVALEAWDTREAVAIGTSWTRDWDPDDRVYHDRRPENDDLSIWPDRDEGIGKDPYLHLVRVDRLDGTPIGLVFTFGVHGTMLGDENPLVSGDAPAGVEFAVQEAFGAPIVAMHLQGAGGDASPSGVDADYAATESTGVFAAPLILAAWETTPTGTAPIRLESAGIHVPEGLEQVRVTRDGATDLYYLPYEEDRVPDEQIFASDGSILSPIDEFNAPSGAAFCGSDEPLIPAGGIGSEVFPYSACMDVELVSRIMLGIFDLEEGDVVLPLPESLAAGASAARVGPFTTRDESGAVADEELLIGFFPAEITAMFTEQWRRRAKDELGFERALAVGYAQDHEGYFLIPEDWLLGGYEPNINLWGPLQGEHVMEGVLGLASAVLGTDVIEPAFPLGLYAPTAYQQRALPEQSPDETPLAGARLTELPDVFWLPFGLERDVEAGLEGGLELEVPASVARVSGVVQLAWEGGDPAVDFPVVVLERQEGSEWSPVVTPGGRVVDTSLADIVVVWNPDPLYPVDAEQDHRWWAAWQAVPSTGDRLALEVGTYRLRVTGQRFTGGVTTYPWPSEPYEVVGEPFEVVPAALQVAEVDGGLSVWVTAPPNGWRLIDVEGASIGDNPVRTDVEVVASGADGAELLRVSATPTPASGRSTVAVALPAEAVTVTVTDAHGNSGTLSR